ncbi:MAG: hypothetical protein ACTSVI_03750 [Promethearchaeota archaeon]
MDVKDVSELNDEVRSNMTDLNQAIANSLGVDEEIIMPGIISCSWKIWSGSWRMSGARTSY